MGSDPPHCCNRQSESAFTPAPAASCQLANGSQAPCCIGGQVCMHNATYLSASADWRQKDHENSSGKEHGGRRRSPYKAPAAEPSLTGLTWVSSSPGCLSS